MDVVSISDVSKERVVSPLFTGEDVFAQQLSPEDCEFNSRVVTFGKGTRNKFHAHESTQILIVTHGKGIVATETEEREVGVGDVIFFRPGEIHWHGATRDSDFAHIYVQLKKGPTRQVEE